MASQQEFRKWSDRDVTVKLFSSHAYGRPSTRCIGTSDHPHKVTKYCRRRLDHDGSSNVSLHPMHFFNFESTTWLRIAQAIPIDLIFIPITAAACLGIPQEKSNVVSAIVNLNAQHLG